LQDISFNSVLEQKRFYAGLLDVLRRWDSFHGADLLQGCGYIGIPLTSELDPFDW
jgi:hypothetical protein